MVDDGGWLVSFMDYDLGYIEPPQGITHMSGMNQWPAPLAALFWRSWHGSPLARTALSGQSARSPKGCL
jgi:hypothetical protein